MKLLVIAYEFPPSPSPQSLRWMYLSRELARLGHEVHVLTADIPVGTVSLACPDGVVVHRSFAGPVRGLLAWLARRKQMPPMAAAANQADAVPISPQPSRLNWKGRLVERFQRVANWVLFPDLRGEWKWSAKRSLRTLLDQVRPDIVISSHEPATTLELALAVRGGNAKWVADIADPVLAAYTPRRWHWRSWRLEAATWKKADLLLLTNEHAAELLAGRHGQRRQPWRIVPQGFDDALPAPMDGRHKSRPKVEFLYTGSFYQFRAPDEFLHAVAMVPGVRLSIASRTVPAVVEQFAAKHPEQIRLLGFLDHRQVLQAQRKADILVNIANADATQVPGKFNEYLGAARPVLHVAADKGQDMIAAFLARTGRGWAVENDREKIAGQLSVLVSARGEVNFGATINPADAAAYGWRQIACELSSAMQDLLR